MRGAQLWYSLHEMRSSVGDQPTQEEKDAAYNGR